MLFLVRGVLTDVPRRVTPGPIGDIVENSWEGT